MIFLRENEIKNSDLQVVFYLVKFLSVLSKITILTDYFTIN